MFDPSSRYYALETKYYTTTEGLKVAYQSRRFLPAGSSMSALKHIKTAENQRIDQITSVNLGDPLRFWSVCDANESMNPWDLVATPGKDLIIPMPQL